LEIGDTAGLETCATVMKIYTFIADSAPEAVAQIRAQLGPEAVVLNVRKIEANGIGKLWKKPQIEVLAHLPEAVEPAPDPLQALTDLRREIADLKQQMPVAAAPAVMAMPIAHVAEPQIIQSRVDYGEWKVGNFLEQGGALPRNVQRILDCVVEEHGANAPSDVAKQFDLARGAILNLGASGASIQSGEPRALHDAGARQGGPHIFVGPAGVGKTTVLSKMLAQRVLLENLAARVFRLDGLRANTAESLSVYCEILGVPVERCRADVSQVVPTETTFIDLPGVGVNDSEGMRAFANQIAAFRGARVHLVLNAAYETNTLLNQLRAFSVLPISDIIFTHLDEEQRWGKMLNFCFGIKMPIAYLSSGQNVPGELASATVEKIVSRVIPSK
jgi:flagellar biosynthesis protein FlhF